MLFADYDKMMNDNLVNFFEKVEKAMNAENSSEAEKEALNELDNKTAEDVIKEFKPVLIKNGVLG
jgi:hypothetical protein